jgi:hypothetical protein
VCNVKVREVTTPAVVSLRPTVSSDVHGPKTENVEHFESYHVTGDSSKYSKPFAAQPFFKVRVERKSENRKHAANERRFLMKFGDENQRKNKVQLSEIREKSARHLGGAIQSVKPIHLRV